MAEKQSKSEKVEEKKEVKLAFELGEVAKTTQLVIRENATGKILTIEEAVAQLLNDVALIKKETGVGA